jgi:hypothetical protein
MANSALRKERGVGKGAKMTETDNALPNAIRMGGLCLALSGGGF